MLIVLNELKLLKSNLFFEVYWNFSFGPQNVVPAETDYMF